MHEMSHSESGEKKREDTRWEMTYLEKLYRPNEAIKRGRGYIIMAYKGARKILAIPVRYGARSRAGWKRRSGRGKSNNEKERGAFTFFLLRSCEDWLASAFSFSLAPEIRSIVPGYRWVSSSQHEKILGLFHREVAEYFVTRQQFCKRDLIRSENNLPLRSIKIRRLHRDESRYPNGFYFFNVWNFDIYYFHCFFFNSS